MNPPPVQGDADDYEIKIDEQVNKFLDLNHKLTFFLVTAAVGTLGYTLTFANQRATGLPTSPWWLLLLGLAGVAGLASAWSGLMALSLDQQSFRLHLRYRYERKSWNDLDEKSRKAWDAVNTKASSARRWAFNLLIATVVTQAAVLFGLILVRGDLPMHHYGEDSTDVVVTDTAYRLEFKNKVSGVKITMEVPAVGVLENPTTRLEPARARTLAGEVAHLLRRVLD